MLTRYEAYMDGVALSSIDPSIAVLDIVPVPGDINCAFATRANREGAVLTNKNKSSEGVQISFEIHEYSPMKRMDICQRVSKWANGEILQTSDRQGQRLRVMCSQYPVVNAKDWTAPVTVVFTAYVLPYWEEDAPAVISLTGTSGNAQIYAPGNAGEVLVEATVKANAAVTTFTLTVGSTHITLSGLSLAANDVVTISYDKNLIQSIKKGNTSLLDKRTGSDDLLTTSGEYVTVEISADASITATFSARGCWH